MFVAILIVIGATSDAVAEKRCEQILHTVSVDSVLYCIKQISVFL